MGYRRGGVFATRRQRHWGRWVALAVLFAVLAGGVYVVIDNGRVVVRTQRVLVSNLPKALEGFTVLHISDLNGHSFGPGQKQVANVLKNKRYSAVCLTGDMIGPRGDPTAFYELLAALAPATPVYFIAGDSDPTPIGGQTDGFYTELADWIRGAQTRNAVFLGAPQSLKVSGATVWFTDASQLPLDLDIAANAYASSSTAVSQYYAGVMAETKAARAQMKEDDLHIALSHMPMSAEKIYTMQNTSDQDGKVFARSVDLILAGGTANGQWRLPIVGPVWSEGWFPGDSMAEGYHVTGGLLEYVSGGLNVSASSPLPKFRLFNTPEVTLITFTSQMDRGVLPE